MMKKRSKHMMCCGCGFVVLAETMFVKEYKNTAICLCRKCAKDLSKEIQQHCKVEIVRCKDCVLKYKSNDGETYCNHSGMPIKPNGYCAWGTKDERDGRIKSLAAAFNITEAEARVEAYILSQKNEAIKEFAERLTNRVMDKIEASDNAPYGEFYYITDVYDDIDNLVKEMTGGHTDES